MNDYVEVYFPLIINKHHTQLFFTTEGGLDTDYTAREFNIRFGSFPPYESTPKEGNED
jgi:hypothetical protein